jgi:ABC-type lipoprotein release transport system permease subunit
MQLQQSMRYLPSKASISARLVVTEVLTVAIWVVKSLTVEVNDAILSIHYHVIITPNQK